MPEEFNTIEVAPSEDNGNVPAEAPSEPVVDEVIPAVEETVQPTEPELYELPDGRKVDAGTVAQEYKNLLSDYTRKSQELASFKNPAQGNLQTEDKPNQYANPEYVPQTYEEIIQEAQKRALEAIEKKQAESVEHEKAVEAGVMGQIEEIKKVDPSLDENKLFLHATKYGFTDLKVAHQNMKDMREIAKTAQKTAVQNIAKRADPVSSSPGATGAKTNPNNFSTAIEYLRSLHK